MNPAPTGFGVLVPALAGAALLIWPEQPPGPRRLARRPGQLPDRWRSALSAIGAGAAVTVAVPRWWWVGLLLAVGVALANRSLPSRPSTARRVAERADLAARLDLIGACLRSGLGTSAALAAVADACAAGSPNEGRRVVRDVSRSAPEPGSRTDSAVDVLDEVRSLLAVGADPVTAWRPATEHPELSTVAAAACRSSAAGTALADAFTEQAAMVRGVNADATVRSAGRAGVLMTAPLGACFLPAFLCLGLAPAVVGLLGSLSLW